MASIVFTLAYPAQAEQAITSKSNHMTMSEEKIIPLITPASQALQKELYALILEETTLLTHQNKSTGVYYENSDLAPYQRLLNDLCDIYQTPTCPKAYFTLKEILGAAMKPDAVLEINPASLKNATPNDIAFIVAHEFEHFRQNHPLRRTFDIAHSVAQHGIMVLDPERLLPNSMLLPGMSEAHNEYEAEADIFAARYLHTQHMRFDCQALMNLLSKGEIISTDKHSATPERCGLIEENL